MLRRRQLVGFEPLDDELDVMDGAPGPEDHLHTRQRYGQLEASLRRLPAAHREVLLLREIEGLSYAEIATALDINERHSEIADRAGSRRAAR